MAEKSRVNGIFLALSLLAILLLFTGCSSLQGLGKKKGTNAEGEPFAGTVYTGTQGLVMQFAKDLPSTIFEGSPIDLIVELRNLGTTSITSGKLYLGGYDKGIVPIMQETQYVTVEGKSQYSQEGGFNTVDFRSQTITLPPGTDVYRPKFVLTACYEYETSATPVVCIDPVPQLGTADKACKPGAANVGSGQGAPVAVTSLYGEALPGKTRFKIEISNVGGGKVVNIRNCPYNLGYSDLNYVDYQISMSGATGKDCKPISPLKLIDGKATLYCTFDVKGQTAYTTPLSIRLIYDYMSSIAKDVEIRSIG